VGVHGPLPSAAPHEGGLVPRPFRCGGVCPPHCRRSGRGAVAARTCAAGDSGCGCRGPPLLLVSWSHAGVLRISDAPPRHVVVPAPGPRGLPIRPPRCVRSPPANSAPRLPTRAAQRASLVLVALCARPPRSVVSCARCAAYNDAAAARGGGSALCVCITRRRAAGKTASHLPCRPSFGCRLPRHIVDRGATAVLNLPAHRRACVASAVGLARTTRAPCGWGAGRAGSVLGFGCAGAC
jgi:hypothetical protein